jgi:glucose-1-phosphate cytidylyltransferase
VRDFVICCGFKGYMIKEYFANYSLHMSDITFDLGSNRLEFHRQNAESWRVTLVDTGENSMTGGRLKRVASYLDPNEPFCFTYGDGVADADISATIAFHKRHGKLATVTAVRPPARFGAMRFDGDDVTGFVEKPEGEGGFINGGFFILHPSVIDRIEGDATSFEGEVVSGLAADGQLKAWFHKGFWQPMDTLRDKIQLENLWASGNPPWKVW